MGEGVEKTPVELWVEALESGLYGQYTSYLHTSAGYCCLGVACDVYQKNVGGLRVVKESPGFKDCPPVVYRYDDSNAGLPVPVLEWLGLKCTLGKYDHGALYAMNDKGSTFMEIAEVIKSRPPGLFVELKPKGGLLDP